MNEGLPAYPQEAAFARIHKVPEHRRGNVLALLDLVGHGDFWEIPRYFQVVRLLDRKDDYRVPQADIATVLYV